MPARIIWVKLGPGSEGEIGFRNELNVCVGSFGRNKCRYYLNQWVVCLGIC